MDVKLKEFRMGNESEQKRDTGISEMYLPTYLPNSRDILRWIRLTYTPCVGVTMNLLKS